MAPFQAFALFLSLGIPAQEAPHPIEFAYAQISDIHVEVLAPGEVVGERKERGGETFLWLAEALAGPQDLPRADKEEGGAPAPEFVLATGDLTEFGAPGETWSAVERLFEMLPLPVYAVPGNHDDTWTPTDPWLRERHGGRNYAFEHGGVLFVGLASSTIQEPVPSLDRDDLGWLRDTLRERALGAPVILFLHHPPDSAEFAQPWQRNALRNALSGRDVALIHYGHGHRPKHHVVDGIDCLQGGTTFTSKGRDDRGYLYVHIAEGKLRASYRFYDEAREALPLLEKDLHGEPVRGPGLEPESSTQLKSAVRAGAVFTSTEKRSDAPHVLAVLQQNGEVRAYWHDSEWTAAWTRQLEGELIAPGATQPGAIILATSLGELAVLAAKDGRVLHSFDLGAPIYASPLVDGQQIFVGDVGGRLHAVDLRKRKVLWSRQVADGPFDAAPVRFGELLVAGAWDGKLHAVSRKSGAPMWSVPGPKSSDGRAARYYAPADSPPVVLGKRLFVCDRGYRLASYDDQGQMELLSYEHVSAIHATSRGDALLLRGTNHSVRCIEPNGELRWEAKCKAGRFPLPPVLPGNLSAGPDRQVIVGGDRGEMTHLDEKDGSVLFTYSTAIGSGRILRGAYVMAPLLWTPPGADALRGTLHQFDMGGNWCRLELGTSQTESR